MALIVEDGSGLATAESYLSEADADTYHTNHGDPSSWSGASSTAKEAALRFATEYVDEKFGRYFKGLRTYEAQRLRFPRTGVEDADGFILAHNALPRRLTDAVAILANESISDGALFADVTTPGLKTKEKIKVGPIEIDDEWSGGGPGSSTGKHYSKARALLLEYLDFSTDRG